MKIVSYAEAVKIALTRYPKPSRYAVREDLACEIIASATALANLAMDGGTMTERGFVRDTFQKWATRTKRKFTFEWASNGGALKHMIDIEEAVKGPNDGQTQWYTIHDQVGK